MNDIYVVVGGSGSVGRQVINRLESRDKEVVTISGENLSKIEDADFDAESLRMSQELANNCHQLKHLGVILTHRQRHTNILTSIRTELRICRDLISQFARNVDHVNAVVLGSTTGSSIDLSSSAAYHFAKDIQKSCVRQSITIPNLNMNLLELSWFDKYPSGMADATYSAKIGHLKTLFGDENVATVAEITDFATLILDASLPPRGQIIPYDAGYSLLQR